MWRRNILYKKREEVKNNLQEKLFLLDDNFREIIMSHRSNCKDMEPACRLIDLKQPGQDTFDLETFKQKQ